MQALGFLFVKSKIISYELMKILSIKINDKIVPLKISKKVLTNNY